MGQICTKLSKKCSLAVKSTIFAGCLAFDIVMILDVEPAAKLIFSIAKLRCSYFHLLNINTNKNLKFQIHALQKSLITIESLQKSIYRVHQKK